MSLRKIEVESGADLRNYTHIKIGGRAKYLFSPETTEDLSNLVCDIGPEFYVLGKGSNLLIENKVILRPIVKLCGGFSFIKREGDFLRVGAACRLSTVIRYCLENELAGLHNLVGIPATIGGLLSMNASSFGQSINFYLLDVEVMDKKGEVKTLPKEEIEFGYRSSSLRDYIILSARFKLFKEEGFKDKVKSLFAKRLWEQDFHLPSCGCIFKNPSDNSAGILIDSCGLKGLQRGDACVSERHANFIVNLGSARYKDVDYLIRKIKDRIYKKYSIILEEEIIRWH